MNNTKISVRYEKEVSEEYVMNEAALIWKEFMNSKEPPCDENAIEQYIISLHETHKEFSSAYPLVIRYMIQFRRFHMKALKRHLRKLSITTHKSESDFLDSQADYVAMLFEHTEKHWNKNDIHNLRKEVRKNLDTERDEFKKSILAATAKLEKTELEVEIEAVRDLLETQKKI
jgi:hypothetical protein